MSAEKVWSLKRKVGPPFFFLQLDLCFSVTVTWCATYFIYLYYCSSLVLQWGLCCKSLCEWQLKNWATQGHPDCIYHQNITWRGRPSTRTQRWWRGDDIKPSWWIFWWYKKGRAAFQRNCKCIFDDAFVSCDDDCFFFLKLQGFIHIPLHDHFPDIFKVMSIQWKKKLKHYTRHTVFMVSPEKHHVIYYRFSFYCFPVK